MKVLIGRISLMQGLGQFNSHSLKNNEITTRQGRFLSLLEVYWHKKLKVLVHIKVEVIDKKYLERYME